MSVNPNERFAPLRAWDNFQISNTLYQILDEFGLHHEFAREIDVVMACPEHDDEADELKKLILNRFESCAETESISETFSAVGFNPGSKVVKKWISSSKTLERHFTIEEQVLFFIDSFYNSVSPIPEWAKEDKNEKEFTLKYDPEFADRVQMRTFKSVQVPGDMKSQKEVTNFIKSLSAPTSESPEGSISWFHVSSFKNVECILQFGIRLQMGKPNANFSCQDGFYLGDNLREICKCLETKFINEPLIAGLVFQYQVDSDPLKRFPGEDLIDPAKEVQLKKVVSFFKKSNVFPSSDPDFEETGLLPGYLKNLEYIAGPVCFFRGKNFKPDGVGVNRNLNQLCLRGTRIKSHFEDIMAPTILVINLQQFLGLSETVEDKSSEPKDRPAERAIVEVERIALFSKASPSPVL